MKAKAKFYRSVQESLVLVTYASSGESVETAHLPSIARAFANRTKRTDVDEGSVKLYKPVKEVWYVMQRAVNP